MARKPQSDDWRDAKRDYPELRGILQPRKRRLRLKPFELPTPKEEQEQIDLFDWARRNETKCPELRALVSSQAGVRMSIGAAVKAKRAGMRSGYPDIFLPVPRGTLHGLYIELKRIKGGVLSDDQRAWRDFLQQQGYGWSCCQGSRVAQKVITDYLNLAHERWTDG